MEQQIINQIKEWEEKHTNSIYGVGIHPVTWETILKQLGEHVVLKENKLTLKNVPVLIDARIPINYCAKLNKEMFDAYKNTQSYFYKGSDIDE